jgi:hypothetical protein
MKYPLLFPYDESSWDKQLMHNGNRKELDLNSTALKEFLTFAQKKKKKTFPPISG